MIVAPYINSLNLNHISYLGWERHRDRGEGIQLLESKAEKDTLGPSTIK